MRTFKQARWNEPLIMELGRHEEEIKDDFIKEISKYIPEKYIRRKLNIPNIPKTRVIRHFTRLTQMNYAIDLGLYPLGSCTMKYNPKYTEFILNQLSIDSIHPLQPPKTIQGLLSILYEFKNYLSEITGMDAFTLQPAAGAQGELTGALIIKKYHEVNGNKYKDEIIIPDSAHGTNPASAKMAGFKVVEIPSNKNGLVDLDALKSAVSKYTAGIMLTNPNTLGLFEKNVLTISKIIHEVNGLLYYDGANLNAIMGWARPGDMGFDIVHVNLHKTFATPHGGGGPGSGPVGVKEYLKEYLPIPYIDYQDGEYILRNDLKYTIGKVHGYYGNISVILRAYLYLINVGGRKLRYISGRAVVNSNYMLRKMIKIKGIELPYNPEEPRMHEFVVSLKKLKEDTGVSARDVSKRLLDYGLHPPTIYFPLIVEEAMMFEPTESASKDEIDEYIEALRLIINEAYENPSKLINAPQNTSVKRVDEAYGSRPKTMAPTYKWLKKRD